MTTKRMGGFYYNKRSIVSSMVRMVPFFEHDDQTRLQMASSQMRQAMLIDGRERPFCMTGYENLSNYGVIKTNKKIYKIYEDEKIMIFKDEQGRNTNFLLKLPFWDIVDKDVYEEGDIVMKHQMLDEYDYVNFGVNALVSFQNYEGLNSDDAIIISESFSKKLSALEEDELEFIIPSDYVPISLSKEKYKPFLEPGDEFKRGDNFYKIMNIKFNRDIKEYKASFDGFVDRIEIYPNTWTGYEWDVYINKYILKMDKLFTEFKQNMGVRRVLKNNMYFDKEKIGKFSRKEVVFDGVYVKIFFKYKKPMRVGDKLANRHGNKGTISRILPDEEMPKFNGKPVDAIFNPLGGISRMNIGQLFEMHTGYCVKLIREHAKTKDEILRYIRYIYKDKYDEMIELYEKDFENLDLEQIKKEFVLFIIFEGKILEYKELITLLFYLKHKYLNFTIDGIEKKHYDILEKVINCEYPKTFFYDMFTKGNDNILYKTFRESVIYKDKHKIDDLGVGYIYLERLAQLVDEKIKHTSIGEYSFKHHQNMDGYKIGEMEHWALMGYDAKYNIKEIDGKCDNFDLKKELFDKMVKGEKIFINDIHHEDGYIFRYFKSLINMLFIDF